MVVVVCLENPRDGGAWWAAVHWVAQSRTRLKRLSSSSSSGGGGLVTKSCPTPATPWTGEPSGLPSIGSHRVGHD